MSQYISAKETVDAAYVPGAEGTKVHDDFQDQKDVQAILIHQYGRNGNQKKWQSSCYDENDSKIVLGRQLHCRWTFKL